MPGHLVQLVPCMTADTCLTADPGVTSSILARSHTFVETDHEIISTAIHLPSAGSRRVAVSYKHVHEVTCLTALKSLPRKSVVR